eukprot:NODE_2715_length_514_cov_537.079570_g2132_i0.p2 GENE.NODE_2715_length_514_cov_537.079570_g2132_i0~~NODE_2715_length_514_cov_537.079570_g2132_i0.p2  ORF type:complete len:65 (-),score=30.55 NODE_2715_length_514_cov_537.079570_g2132_i0:81-275(-)
MYSASIPQRRVHGDAVTKQFAGSDGCLTKAEFVSGVENLEMTGDLQTRIASVEKIGGLMGFLGA